MHNPSMFPGEFSLLSRIPGESHPTTEAMAWREPRARLPWRSLPICSHPSQELNLPMERKPDTRLPAASESDPAFLFSVAETKGLAHSLLGLRQESLQRIFLRGSPEAGVTRSWPAFLGLGLASSALALSQASRTQGSKQHQDLELRHRQLIPLSWPPQWICLVGLRLKPLNDSSC